MKQARSQNVCKDMRKHQKKIQSNNKHIETNSVQSTPFGGKSEYKFNLSDFYKIQDFAKTQSESGSRVCKNDQDQLLYNQPRFAKTLKIQNSIKIQSKITKNQGESNNEENNDQKANNQKDKQLNSQIELQQALQLRQYIKDQSYQQKQKHQQSKVYSLWRICIPQMFQEQKPLKIKKENQKIMTYTQKKCHENTINQSNAFKLQNSIKEKYSHMINQASNLVDIKITQQNGKQQSKHYCSHNFQQIIFENSLKFQKRINKKTAQQIVHDYSACLLCQKHKQNKYQKNYRLKQEPTEKNIEMQKPNIQVDSDNQIKKDISKKRQNFRQVITPKTLKSQNSKKPYSKKSLPKNSQLSNPKVVDLTPKQKNKLDESTLQKQRKQYINKIVQQNIFLRYNVQKQQIDACLRRLQKDKVPMSQWPFKITRYVSDRLKIIENNRKFKY